jgi:hypothetical protein
MSTDGWIWATERRHLFKSPLEVLVALRIGDSGGLQYRERETSFRLKFEWMADQCACTVAEAIVAVQSVAVATEAELEIIGGEFTFRVPEFATPPDYKRWRKPEITMREQFDAMRPKLVREGFLTDPCRACGAPAEVIDHNIPIARGGTNDCSNLQPLCAFCNNTKKTKTMAEFMAWRIRVAGSA